ncbi:MAG: Nucleoside-diphosphate kinase [Firmicutes bacterium]|nr:Nucleoside-diphosphate kinase [Bacillota bacterium]
MKETTLVLLKPDAVQRKLSGEIILRFDQKDLQIIGLKMLRLSKDQAEKHYAEHCGKPFFPRLVEFITSGPLIAIAVQGDNAVQIVRRMMGSTDPAVAHPGTIRGDYALTMERNVIHASDSLESAARELRLFFLEHELFGIDGGI